MGGWAKVARNSPRLLRADVITQRDSSNMNFFIIGTKYFLRKLRLHRIEIIGMIWAHALRMFHDESSQSFTNSGNMLDSNRSMPSTSHSTGKTVAHCFRMLGISHCVSSMNLSKNVSWAISVPMIGATFAITWKSSGVEGKISKCWNGKLHKRWEQSDFRMKLKLPRVLVWRFMWDFFVNFSMTARICKNFPTNLQ